MGGLMDAMEYLRIPGIIAISLIALFFIMQIIGEFLEFKGKVVPEFLKIRKYFARKKKERQTIRQMPDTLRDVQILLNDVNKHYDADNIAKRDNWINWVNGQAKIYDYSIAELEKKMDKNNEITLSLLIEHKRNVILDFASRVVDEKYPATREQFHRVFKIYEEYEKIIEENDLTNGEVDIAYRIITEAYEDRLKEHSFIEDIRGYNKSK